MKRTKIVATVSTGILCLALLIVGVWAAVVANFSISTKLTFNPNGVYVELSGQIYRGASYSELEPLLDDPSYTLQPCKNYTTEEAVDGTSTSTTYSISSWNPEEVLFLPTEKVIQFKLNVTNKGDKQISVVPKNDVTITGVTVTEEASDTLAIPAGETREYRITLTAGTTELKSVPFELGLDMVNTEDIENPASDFTMNSTTTTQLDAINTGYSNPVYGQRIVVVPTSLGAKSTCSSSNYAFKNLEASTKYLVLPEGLKTLKNYLIPNNDSLGGISIPSSVTSIVSMTFSGCSSLMITVDEANAKYSSLGGSLYNKAQTTLIRGAGKAVVNDMPSTMTIIGDHAFSGCASLTSITIPRSVKRIYSYAFSGCASLTSIIIPSSVTDISNWVFSSCSSLMITVDEANTEYSSLGGSLYNKEQTTLLRGAGKAVIDDIPSTVTSLGTGAFDGCASCTVTFPSGVTTIPPNFAQNSLLSIIVEEGNATFSSLNGSLYNKSKTTLIWHKMQQEVDDIPNSVSAIEAYAFCRNTLLTSITIPSSVETVGSDAFEGCSALKSITIPENVRSVGTLAFACGSSLVAVAIDSQSIVNILTSPYDSSYSCLVEYATSIYIKSGLSTTSATYLTGNFTKQSSSDKSGYDKWVKNG